LAADTCPPRRAKGELLWRLCCDNAASRRADRRIALYGRVIVWSLAR